LKTVIIIQARTTSTRLPGKALLPVAGYPSAILAALRAGNRRTDTTLATSDDISDDVLARRARECGVTVFRGPLDDVLGRYFLAAKSLADDDVIIRLTADNVVPDGTFVEELARAFHSQDVEYLGMDRLQSRMPYGLGGEAFSVRALRLAHSRATVASDREHVGPWMQRNCRSGIFIPHLPDSENFSHLRCTMDDEEDYRRVLALFSGVADPLAVGWLELARKLAAMVQSSGDSKADLPDNDIAATDFVLGTAQLGMGYGYVNHTGQPSRSDAVALVRGAVERGVTAFDTARAYGESENILGEALRNRSSSEARVITKLDLSSIDHQAIEAEVRRGVDASVTASLKALRRDKLEAVLLHNWKYYGSWHGAAWQRLCELKQQGTIDVLGASVYEPGEALEALREPSIQHLQIPVNILDRRLRNAGVDRAAMIRPDVAIHARSAFLQGILLHPANRWPGIAHVDREGLAGRLLAFAEAFHRDGLADLCLSYVRSLPWITGVVVGCETRQQLDANLRLFSLPKLSADQILELEDGFRDIPEALLNPSKWEVVRQPVLTYAT
jgi:aryl-alcohol dehydrogenase-like predicted oxidoreductase/spore coat polysaccharide biosynthesis protein SpsF (cytidylyltransferase family)